MYKFLSLSKLFIFVFVASAFSHLSGQGTFTVNYNFNENGTPAILAGKDVMMVSEFEFGGSKLTDPGYISEDNVNVWKGKLSRGNHNVFNNSYALVNLYPKNGFKLSIHSIQIKSKGSEHKENYFRIGCSISGNIPDINNTDQTSGKILFKDTYATNSFEPDRQFAKSRGVDYLSVWIGTRGGWPSDMTWTIDELIIKGSYEKEDNATNKITVSKNIKQNIRLGIDAERLWFWSSGMKEELAQLAVGDMKPDYIRVAITAKYEREKGVKDESAYKDELEMMHAMRAVNPDIKFFASPRPLFEAYSKKEREDIWGHKDNTPWSPYPAWILSWYQDGAKKSGDGATVTKWKEGQLDLPALVQYFADYLNFMYQNGFEIAFLDITNEKETVSPSENKYIYENLPKLLNPRVKTPKLIAPSSWEIKGAVNWMKKVDMSKNEHQYFDIASTHNTGNAGVHEELVRLGNEMGKEVWNTEMHDWVGVDLSEEILTSDALWKHLSAGFTGIDTWLFYGPAQGRGHTMIWVDEKNKIITKSGKYEIFKQLVNNANGGNYVEISKPYESIYTAAMIKGDILSVWALNKSKSGMQNTVFDAGRMIKDNKCDVYRWNKDLPKTGEQKTIATEKNKFSFDIAGESLYFFKIKLNEIKLNE